ncbi:MAG: hypothetical protein KDC09_04280 [Bacteroidales bacterium]|nr:hypothetical protein [Bacteroidales bacterium]
MQEKSYIQYLDEFSKKTGLTYTSSASETKHTLIAADKFTNTKYAVFDLSRQLPGLYLVFSDTHSPRSSYQFCGLFYKLKNCNNENKIVKRYRIDSLNMKKRIKTGNDFIDKEVNIFAENENLNDIRINSENIRQFLEVNKKLRSFHLATICNSLSSVPLLKGQNWLAFQTESRWVLEYEELKFLHEKGSKLLSSFIQ